MNKGLKLHKRSSKQNTNSVSKEMIGCLAWSFFLFIYAKKKKNIYIVSAISAVSAIETFYLFVMSFFQSKINLV